MQRAQSALSATLQTPVVQTVQSKEVPVSLAKITYSYTLSFKLLRDRIYYALFKIGKVLLVI